MPWHSTNGGGGGAPATPATVPISIDQAYNVQDYGAVGDGSTDDTAEIQACIDAAEAFTVALGRGAVVYFPSGKYAISAPLTVTRDNIILRGYGATGVGMGTTTNEATNPVTGGSIILPNGSFAGSWVIDMAFDTASVRALVGCWIEDLSIDGFYLPAGTTGGINFSVFRGGMRRVHVERLSTNGATGPGIQMKSVDDVTTFPKGAWDNLFSGCVIQDVVGVGFYAPGQSSDSFIHNCIIEESGSHGIHLVGPGWTVTNNYINNCGGKGIYTEGRQYNITGNRIRDNVGGIECRMAATAAGGFTIVGNNFRNCSQGGDGVNDVITITASASTEGGIISDNQFETLQHDDATAYRPRYLVNITSANSVGVTLGPIGTGYSAPATTAFTTAAVSDSGTATRYLTGRQMRLVNTDGTTTVATLEGTANTSSAQFTALGKTGAGLVVNGKLHADSGGRVSIGSGNSSVVDFVYSNGAKMTLNSSGNVAYGEGVHIQFGTATGTMLGTAAAQKLAHWGATPVIQPSGTGETVGFVAGAGTAVNDQSTFTGNVGTKAYRISDIVKALKQAGLIASS